MLPSKMALRNLACCMVMVMVLVLLIALAPGTVEGSSRRLFDQTNGASAAPAAATHAYGVCSTLVTPYGYKCEELYVTTADGYILNMQRIPSGRNGGGAGKPPVIIQHGVLVDSATWLLNSPDKNLPMIMADAGYDVWMANTRGTRFSRRHISLDPRDPRFWNWSFDEMVAHDLPAVFNYVQGRTNQKIYYIGHSLGTLLALASLSEGRLVHQLKSVALLSPIAYLRYMKTPLGAVGARVWAAEITRVLGFAEFDPKSVPVSDLIDFMCKSRSINCYNLLAVLTGQNCCLNDSTVELFLENEPQSTSTKTMIHLSQVVRTNVVAKYDYESPDKNFMHYKSMSPPRYNLSMIPTHMPIFISYGGMDSLSDVNDVLQLLHHHFKSHEMAKLHVDYIPKYAHADYTMGNNANELVYSKVISFFQQQQQ